MDYLIRTPNHLFSICIRVFFDYDDLVIGSVVGGVGFCECEMLGGCSVSVSFFLFCFVFGLVYVLHCVHGL